jgi:hypothetical protein
MEVGAKVIVEEGVLGFPMVVAVIWSDEEDCGDEMVMGTFAPILPEYPKS